MRSKSTAVLASAAGTRHSANASSHAVLDAAEHAPASAMWWAAVVGSPGVSLAATHPVGGLRASEAAALALLLNHVLLPNLRRAQSGTGKTATFCISALQSIDTTMR